MTLYIEIFKFLNMGKTKFPNVKALRLRPVYQLKDKAFKLVKNGFYQQS